MSVLNLNRKRAAEAEDTRNSLQQLARSAALVRAAVPMAKTAGTTARVGARNAATWAGPRVNGARTWTAVYLERSGLAINDSIAPRISEMLTAAARRVDVERPPVDVTAARRRWPKVLATTAMLTAAGAAAAVVLRRRKDDGTGGASEEEEAGAGTGPQTEEGEQPRADTGDTGDGASPEDVSRQSQAT